MRRKNRKETVGPLMEGGGGYHMLEQYKKKISISVPGTTIE